MSQDSELSEDETVSVVGKSRNKILLSDSEDDDDNDDDQKDESKNPAEETTENSGKTELKIGKESSVRDSNSDIDDESITESNTKKKERVPTKQKTSTAMLEIRSASQRRIRESALELPYHCPKRRSLDEFLNRKKTVPDVLKSWKQRIHDDDNKLLLQRERNVERFYSNDDEHNDDDDDNDDREITEKRKEKDVSSSKSKVLRKLSRDVLERTLQVTPKLGTGLFNENDDFIDDSIDLGSIERVSTASPGVSNLQSRVLRHTKVSKMSHVSKSIHTLSVVSKETDKSGVQKLKTQTVTYKTEEKSDDTKSFPCVEKAKRSEIPGAQILALKTALKSQMAEKRKLERMKRAEMKKIENEDFEEPELESGSDSDSEPEQETESEPEPEPELVEKPRKTNAYIDYEAEDEEDVPLTLEEMSDEEESRIKTTTPSTTPFSQIANSSVPRWTPLEEREDDDSGGGGHKNDNDIDSTTQQHARKKLGFEGLFDESDPKVDDFGDVIDLCSGQFVSQMTESRVETNDNPDTMILSHNDNDDDNNDDDDDNNDNDDDDKDDNVEEEEEELVLKKNKRKRLVMSDDSEDDDNNDNEDNDDRDDNKVEEEEASNVEYDSEENEISKNPLTDKIGRLRQDFIEKEAELSGSDVGSDDEDEEGEMDKLEMEEGDLDDIDVEKVRDEVGRIHHDRILDEDKREIRLFQEAFLEDGDLHSEKSRQRTFRWKNNDEDDEHDKKFSDEDEELDADTEELEKLRLERLEREKWLKESQNNTVGSDEEDENDGDSENEEGKDESHFFNLGNKALKKLQGSKKITTVASKDFKSPSKKLPLGPLITDNGSRGSFLKRTSDRLQRLAEMTKTTKTEEREGSGVKGNSKNFVFATISPKKSEQKKNSVEEKRSKPVKKKPKMERTLNTKTVFGFL